MVKLDQQIKYIDEDIFEQYENRKEEVVMLSTRLRISERERLASIADAENVSIREMVSKLIEDYSPNGTGANDNKVLDLQEKETDNVDIDKLKQEVREEEAIRYEEMTAEFSYMQEHFKPVLERGQELLVENKKLMEDNTILAKKVSELKDIIESIHAERGGAHE
jgi:septum formation inhibitor MinC